LKNKYFINLLFFYLAAALFTLFAFLVIQNFLSAKTPTLFLTLLISTLAGLILSILYSSRFFSRLERISSFMDSIKKRNFDRYVRPADNDFFSLLERNAADMAEEIRGTIEKLEDELGQRESILSSMGEAVVVINPSGKIILSNKKAKDIFVGISPGMKISQLSRDPMLLNLVEEGKQKWTSASGEITLAEPKKMTLHLTVSPLIRNMKTQGSVIIFHDITLLKKLENVRKDFVVNVSHELKTPLTSIRGFSETLIDGGIDDRENALRFLNIIKNNSERLSRLVEDLLVLSNIEMGKLKFEKRKIKASDAVTAAAAILKPKASAKQLELTVNADESLTVMADGDRLEQILINLIDNAIKFTDKGKINVSVSDIGGMTKFAVSDTGAGVPGKDIPRLGERFYRADSARSRDLGGTGLGLAIVKHLLNSMGGSFSIESEQGKGTTVSFILPDR